MSTAERVVCMRPMGKIAACEIAFVPVKTSGGTGHISQVVELIKKSGLEYRVGPMSTFVRGERDKIFALLEEIYATMEAKCDFVISARISNICGCKSQVM